MMNRLVQVEFQKRFPMYQASSMHQVAGFGRGSACHKELEKLPVDWERVIILAMARQLVLCARNVLQ